MSDATHQRPSDSILLGKSSAGNFCTGEPPVSWLTESARPRALELVTSQPFREETDLIGSLRSCTSVPLVVGTPGMAFLRDIAPGSALAIARAGKSAYALYFEGGILARSGRDPSSSEWTSYAQSAAGRALVNAPTIARRYVENPQGLIVIGYVWFAPGQHAPVRMFHPNEGIPLS